MQLLAMITMLIDHIGIVFFPHDEVWRVVGRLAFPIYAFGIVQGWTYTSNRKRYMIRLAIIGAAAQLPYMLYLQSLQINVIGSFLIVLSAFYLLERSERKSAQLLALIFAVAILHFLPFDYGAYGLGLMWIYRYLLDKSKASAVSAHIALNCFAFFYFGGWLQMYSILSTLIIVTFPQLPGGRKLKVPVWLWRSFYPAHFAVLLLVSSILSGFIEMN